MTEKSAQLARIDELHARLRETVERFPFPEPYEARRVHADEVKEYGAAVHRLLLLAKRLKHFHDTAVELLDRHGTRQLSELSASDLDRLERILNGDEDLELA